MSNISAKLDFAKIYTVCKLNSPDNSGLSVIFTSDVDSCACMCLRFSVFVWTLVHVLVFLSVCMDSGACACVSQCLYGLLCLCLYFSVFVWTLLLALVFLSVCMVPCACTPYPMGCFVFLTSRKRTPSVSGELCLIPRVSAYGRFDCISLYFS